MQNETAYLEVLNQNFPREILRNHKQDMQQPSRNSKRIPHIHNSAALRQSQHVLLQQYTPQFYAKEVPKH